MALTGRQLKAVELMVYTNMTKQDIAKECGISTTSLGKWVNKEEFQIVLQQEMRRAFSGLATKAISKLEELLDSSMDAVAFAAAKEILNKAGYNEVQKIEQEVKTHVINVEIVD